jgi:glyoxylase-like metal-dependent hydrolase (beta-lactamase superfamily II)
MTCSARVPARLRTGALCLLVETNEGLLLVDTGLGSGDYVDQALIHRVFRVVTIVPMNPEEASARRIARLGYRPEDVQHIVLTHMHFDHCGGLPDFPNATVHVHRNELDAFQGPRRTWLDFGYLRRHWAHGPDVVTYGRVTGKWYDFDAIRLPFEPEMWLVPLFGHTRGHCGVAIRVPSGWHFHAGDAVPPGLDVDFPYWAIRLVLGSHTPRLLAFAAAHPEVEMTAGHMPLTYFAEELVPDGRVS